MTLTPLQAYFRSLARYNRWAKGLLYDACARLSEAEYKKVRPAFFKSVHGVLNHILVCDRNYHARFTGSGAAMYALDQVLYVDFTGLHVARQAEDAQLIAWADGLDDSDLAAEVRYKRGPAARTALRSRSCSATSSTTRPITAARPTTCSRRPRSRRPRSTGSTTCARRGTAQLKAVAVRVAAAS